MAENPNDTTQVRDAKARQPVEDARLAGKVSETKAEQDARLAGQTREIPAAEVAARQRDPLRQTTSLADGMPVKPVISAEQYPLPSPVTLHLMDADERTVLDRVQVKVRPLVFELDGNRYQQVREQPDGSWIYRHLVK